MSPNSTPSPAASLALFGTAFAPTMASARFDGDDWQPTTYGPVEAIPLHPATHALHYGSSCFEGLKAHRGQDGVVRLFRPASHVARMQESAARLLLPVPDSDQLSEMIRRTTAENRSHVPDPPGSLYLRPVLLGTDPNIGAAAAPSRTALLFVLASPVGDYFAGGLRPLKVAVETEIPRTTPQFGMVKTGANYAMALGVTQEAKRELGIDQVLFAPGGDVQETGASNFLLLDDERVVTRHLDEQFLHGITRDSLLTLAADLGYRVEERAVSVEEILEWAERGEAALAGTAAVLAPVGTFVYRGVEYPVGGGEIGPNALRLRRALTELQAAEAPDPYGWTVPV